MNIIRRIIVACALAAALAGGADAQNILGVYTDPNAFTPGVTSVQLSPNTTLPLYFVLSDPTEDSSPVFYLGSFEFACTITPAASFTVVSETIVGGGVNYYVSPRFAVEFPAPMPVFAGRILLLTWEIMITSAESHDLVIASTSRPFMLDGLAYQNADTQNLVALVPSSGSQEAPVLLVNPPVDTDKRAFGSVKALFR